MYELKISAAGSTSNALGKFRTLKAARAYQLTLAQAYALGINEGDSYMRVIQKLPAGCRVTPLDKFTAAAKKEKQK